MIYAADRKIKSYLFDLCEASLCEDQVYILDEAEHEQDENFDI